MQEQFQKIMLAQQNIVNIIWDTELVSKEEGFPIILSKKFGGKNKLIECIEEINDACNFLTVLGALQADVLSLRQAIWGLEAIIKPLRGLLSEATLGEIKVQCNSIRVEYESLRQQLILPIPVPVVIAAVAAPAPPLPLPPIPAVIVAVAAHIPPPPPPPPTPPTPPPPEVSIAVPVDQEAPSTLLLPPQAPRRGSGALYTPPLVAKKEEDSQDDVAAADNPFADSMMPNR